MIQSCETCVHYVIFTYYCLLNDEIHYSGFCCDEWEGV